MLQGFLLVHIYFKLQIKQKLFRYKIAGKHVTRQSRMRLLVQRLQPVTCIKYLYRNQIYNGLLLYKTLL